MATTEQLMERLEALEEAIASGEQSSRFADRGVVYRSITEMRSVAASLRKQLGLDQAKPRTRYFEFRDGSSSSSGEGC